jgi:hypothetical protein
VRLDSLNASALELALGFVGNARQLGIKKPGRTSAGLFVDGCGEAQRPKPTFAQGSCLASRPHDVGADVLFLASDDGNYVNASELSLMAGWHRFDSTQNLPVLADTSLGSTARPIYDFKVDFSK